MEHGLHDLARHNAWATAQLLTFCGELDGSTSDATVPGTYGTIIEILHHANEHRTHVCTILGAHGFEPPDVSAWGYALATGRMTPTTTPADA